MPDKPEKPAEKKVVVSTNCPKCQKVVQAEKSRPSPGATHSVRYMCQECKGSWVVAVGGSFDPTQL